MVKFKVFRYDPDVDKNHRYDEFQVPVENDSTVLESLFYILENHDASLAYRCSCRAAVCGSCGMKINGRYGLACRTLVKDLKSNTIIIEPLAHLPLLKDLVVDMTDFYKKYEIVEPYLIPKEIPDEHKEFCQSPESRKGLDGLVECILCGSCYSACTMCSWDSDFPGPFALLAADAKLKDDRDAEGRERILKYISESGIWRCHTELRCTDVCPKELKPTEAITHLKREAVKYPFLSSRRKELRAKEKKEVSALTIPPPPSDPNAPFLERRSFLKSVFIAGGGLIGAAFFGLFSASFLSKQVRGWVTGWIEVGPMPKVDVEKPIEVIYNKKRWEKGRLVSYPKRAYIIKDKAGNISAIDPTCTHLGCVCYWEDSIRNFLCPCHGGAFDMKGKVTLGPPPRPLEKLDVKVEGGALYLRNLEEA